MKERNLPPSKVQNENQKEAQRKSMEPEKVRTTLLSVNHRIAIHFEPKDLDETQQIRLRQLSNLFSGALSEQLQVLGDLIEGRHRVSLRLIDFVCVNYSRKKPVVYKLVTDSGDVLWNLHQSYQQWLRCWRRRGFDVFRRSGRITCQCGPVAIDTTYSQFNFMYWLLNYRVLDFIQANQAALESDMIQTLREAKEKLEKKQRSHRGHITQPSKHRVSIYETKRSVIFDSDESDGASSCCEELDDATAVSPSLQAQF
jgi:hypothetical protein